MSSFHRLTPLSYAMKQSILFCVLVMLISACRKKEPRPAEAPASTPRATVQSKPPHQYSGSPAAPAKGKPLHLSDALPLMTAVGAGPLSREAMEVVFQEVTGKGMDPAIIPKSGRFGVLDEKAVIPGNCRILYVDYTTSPIRARELIGELQSRWQSIAQQKPDYRFGTSTVAEAGRGDVDLVFTPGTRFLQVYDPYADYREIDYKAFIDPNTGHLCIRITRGPNGAPDERPLKEK